jgi:hypothetical protein
MSTSNGYNFTSPKSLVVLNELCVELQRLCCTTVRDIKFELVCANIPDDIVFSKKSKRNKIPAYSFDFESPNKLEVVNKMLDSAKMMNFNISYIDCVLDIVKIELQQTKHGGNDEVC